MFLRFKQQFLNLKKLLLFVIVSLRSVFLFAQFSVPENYFSSPLRIPIILSGNFGELRTNHFHAGLDIISNMGEPVYAPADGYVSLVSIAPNNHGKSLQITHFNGLITSYSHLYHFSPILDSLIREVQYKKQDFKVTAYFTSDYIPVRKGDLIAFTGNSGASAGPHLHFEIINEKSHKKINPLLFNFNIEDLIKPVIYRLAIYPLGGNSSVEFISKKQIYKLKGKNGKYTLPKKVVNVAGKVGFGIQTLDFVSKSKNQCGVYSIDVFVDDVAIFQFKADEIDPEETRSINSMIDYEEYKDNYARIQQTFIAPNNKLALYKSHLERGIFQCVDNKIHKVRIVVKDFFENESKLIFNIQRKTQGITKSVITHRDYQFVMPFNKDNFIINKDIRISIFKNTLFDTIYFKYTTSTQPKDGFSEVFHIGDINTPLHNAYTLSIRAMALPERLINKVLITGLKNEKQKYYVGGTWINGFVTATPNYFGSFYITVDTIPPSVKQIQSKTSYSNSSQIDFTISDELSGISSFNGYIDHKWVLFEYDTKTARLTHRFDPQKTKFGKWHTLLLEVSDNKENTRNLRVEFFK